MRAWGLFVVVLLTASIVVSPSTAQVQRRENGWSERGLFVFSPGYFFDFWLQRAGVYGAHMSSQLTDCSNADYYCLREGWFAVTVPRVCQTLHVGDSWTVDGVTTRVVARTPTFRDPHNYPPGDYFVWILTTDSLPNTAYLYDPPFGIKALYQGSQGTNARAIAEAGQIDADGDDLNRLNLISTDSLGWCRE